MSHDPNPLNATPVAQWIIKHATGEQYGPFSWDQIKQFTQEGRVGFGCFVFHPDKTKGKWIGIEKIKQLCDILPHSGKPDLSSDEDFEHFEGVLTDGTGITPVKLGFSTSSSIRKSDSSGSLLDVFDFSFKRFATPVVIKALWILFVFSWAVVDIVLLFLAFMLIAATNPSYISDNLVLILLIWLPAFILYKAFTLLAARLVFESTYLLFDIRRLLKEMR